MRKVLAIALVLSGWLTQVGEAQNCLSYEPAVVEVSGKILRKTLPGPPNYESVKRGDRPETGWYLHLTKPICVDGKEGDEFNQPAKGVTDLQLVFVKQDKPYQQYRKFLNQNVVIKGTLFGAQTGHHHTPVLLEVEEIR